MSYDPIKVREHLKILNAFAGTPNFPYLQELADMLKGAEDAISESLMARRKAEQDASRYAMELETSNATVRRLREENEALKAAAPAPKKATPAKTPKAPTISSAPTENAPVVPLPPQGAPKLATEVEKPKREKKAK